LCYVLVLVVRPCARRNQVRADSSAAASGSDALTNLTPSSARADGFGELGQTECTERQPNVTQRDIEEAAGGSAG
jgi:hypothetical protein